jgi:hypothetical protein
MATATINKPGSKVTTRDVRAPPAPLKQITR